MYFSWTNYQYFATLASAGATLIALSAAWLSFIDSKNTRREAESNAKRTLIEAIRTELTAMAPWTGGYSFNHDYTNDGAVFVRWRAPFVAPVHPIVHNAISLGATTGFDRGFSQALVTALVALEFQLNRFDRARRQIDDVANNNFEVADSVSRKIAAVNEPEGTIITPADLSASETNFMNRFFELNRIMHQRCIGDQSNGPNLHIMYNAANALIAQEEVPDSEESFFEKAGHFLAWVFVVGGICIILSSPLSFGQPDPSASQAASTATIQPLNIPTSQSSNSSTTQPVNTPASQTTNSSTTQPTATPTGQSSSNLTGQPVNTPTRQTANGSTSQSVSTPTGQTTNTPTSQPVNAPAGQATSGSTIQPVNRSGKQ